MNDIIDVNDLEQRLKNFETFVEKAKNGEYCSCSSAPLEPIEHEIDSFRRENTMEFKSYSENGWISKGVKKIRIKISIYSSAPPDEPIIFEGMITMTSSGFKRPIGEEFNLSLGETYTSLSGGDWDYLYRNIIRDYDVEVEDWEDHGQIMFELKVHVMPVCVAISIFELREP